MDTSGNVYVTGWSLTSTCNPFGGGNPNSIYTTIKYAPNGDTVWVRYYDRPGSNGDGARALALDKSGNIYVTGESEILGCPVDQASASVREGSKKVDRTGYSYNSVAGVPYAVVKYAPNGDLLWVSNANAPYDFEIANALVVDDSGNVYVTGQSPGDFIDYSTIKYIQFTCSAKLGDATEDGLIRLSDIVRIINHLYRGQPAPTPLCRADANADGNILLSDIVYLINFLFKSGPAPLKSKECCL